MGLTSRGRALLGLAATGLLLLAVPAPARAQGWCYLPDDINCNAPEYGNGHCTGCSTRVAYCDFWTGCTSDQQGCPSDSFETHRTFAPCPEGQSDKHCERLNMAVWTETCASCLFGWVGPYCQYSNAFTCNDHGYVSYNGQCTCDPGYGGPNCCPAGWTGPGGCATDIDECLVDEGPCLNDGTCTNTPGSYTCECVPPYIGANCETFDRIFMDGFELPTITRPWASLRAP